MGQMEQKVDVVEGKIKLDIVPAKRLGNFVLGKLWALFCRLANLVCEQIFRSKSKRHFQSQLQIQ